MTWEPDDMLRHRFAHAKHEDELMKLSAENPERLRYFICNDIQAMTSYLFVLKLDNGAFDAVYCAQDERPARFEIDEPDVLARFLRGES